MSEQGMGKSSPYIQVLLGTSWSEKWDIGKKKLDKVHCIDDIGYYTHTI